MMQNMDVDSLINYIQAGKQGKENVKKLGLKTKKKKPEIVEKKFHDKYEPYFEKPVEGEDEEVTREVEEFEKKLAAHAMKTKVSVYDSETEDQTECEPEVDSRLKKKNLDSTERT
jgi:hypothetical protein